MSRSVAILFDRLGPYHLARLRAAALSLHVLALEVCGESRDYPWDRVDDETLRRVTLFPDRDSGSLRGPEVRKELFARLDEEAPDAVAVPGWASAAALSALAWCRSRRRPAVLMSESCAWDEARTACKEGIKGRVVKLAAAGLAGGPAHRDYLQILGLKSDRIFLGYDVVDNDYFRRAAIACKGESPAKFEAPKRYFLASSRFVEKKNLPALFAAYAQYRSQAGENAWSLVLLGDGPLRPQLEARRRELGLDGSIQFAGFRQYHDLPAFYAHAAAFIHVSTIEQWGLVVNEAMACGLPVLVSNRCGCAADLVYEGRNGWTFDPYDVPAIADALTRISQLPEPERIAMGSASAVRIAAWSPKSFAEGLSAAVEVALTNPLPKAAWFDGLLLHTLLLRQ